MRTRANFNLTLWFLLLMTAFAMYQTIRMNAVTAHDAHMTRLFLEQGQATSPSVNYCILHRINPKGGK